MLKHVVLIKFKEGYTEEQVQAIRDGMNGLPEKIPQIIAYSHGTDAGNTDSAYDYGIVADFASDEDYVIYRDHPAHREIGAAVMAIMADAAQMQFSY